jgi:hypothetical protein
MYSVNSILDYQICVIVDYDGGDGDENLFFNE